MIEAHDVTVTTGDVTLLAPVSVRVARGETLVVRGRNGSGKSTLLRVLAGSRRPSHGTVRLDGRPISERDRGFRRRVAAMIGLPPLAPELTVFEHVLMVAVTWDARGTAAASPAEERARRVISELGLGPLARRFPHELSSGQTQLLGLALVLARPFDVLILDEPEQRLDPEHIETVGAVLHARREAGATVVLATHSASLAERVAQHTLTLDAAA